MEQVNHNQIETDVDPKFMDGCLRIVLFFAIIFFGFITFLIIKFTLES